MGGSSHQLADQLELEASLIIRPTRAEDDEGFARLLSLVMSADFNAERLRERRQRWSQKYWFDRVAVLDGTVVGIMEMIQAGKPGTATVRIVVDPDLRGKGIGSALLREMKTNPEYARRRLFCEVRDNDPNSLSFMEKEGFRKGVHSFESVLDPANFDVANFQPYIEKALASGIRIATLAELGDTAENRYKLWEIEHVTDMDIPGIEPDEMTSWEDAQKSWFSASWYDPAGEFVALDGDQWIGLSGVAELSPGNFYVQHTCTLRDYRGRGIAIAVKALATDYAKRRNAERLTAHNNEGNEAVLAINRKFGFVPQPGWLHLVREPLSEGEK